LASRRVLQISQIFPGGPRSRADVDRGCSELRQLFEASFAEKSRGSHWSLQASRQLRYFGAEEAAGQEYKYNVEQTEEARSRSRQR